MPDPGGQEHTELPKKEKLPKAPSSRRVKPETRGLFERIAPCPISKKMLELISREEEERENIARELQNEVSKVSGSEVEALSSKEQKPQTRVTYGELEEITEKDLHEGSCITRDKLATVSKGTLISALSKGTLSVHKKVDVDALKKAGLPEEYLGIILLNNARAKAVDGVLDRFQERVQERGIENSAEDLTKAEFDLDPLIVPVVTVEALEQIASEKPNTPIFSVSSYKHAPGTFYHFDLEDALDYGRRNAQNISEPVISSLALKELVLMSRQGEVKIKSSYQMGKTGLLDEIAVVPMIPAMKGKLRKITKVKKVPQTAESEDEILKSFRQKSVPNNSSM